MNLKKQFFKLDTSCAYAGTTNSAQEYHSISYLDIAADNFEIGGDYWIIEEVSDKTITVEGYDSDDSTKDNIPIVTVLSAVDLTYNNTILIVTNEATIMGEPANTL